MNQTTLALVMRRCTEVEEQALSHWSASCLPHCRNWAATRGLQPPLDVLETLQYVRFGAQPITETMLRPLLRVSQDCGQHELPMEHSEQRDKITNNLRYDLQHMYALLSQADVDDCQQRFLTHARDLRRFRRVMSQLQLTRIEIAITEPLLVTAFSLPKVTLYIPRWLVDALPDALFVPNQSFYRARRASLVWLLLDAIVITTTNEFKML